MLRLVLLSVSWDFNRIDPERRSRRTSTCIKGTHQDLLDSVLCGALVLVVGLERLWSRFKDCDASLKDLRCTVRAAHSLLECSKFLTTEDSGYAWGPKDVSAL